MSSAPESVGTLDVALRHTAQLLQTDATLAAEQAVEILKAVPGHPVAALYLGAARRLQGEIPTALAILEPLARQQPNSAVTYLELGLALGRAGRGNEAVTALRRAVALKPDLAEAWRTLADHLAAMGDAAGADEAYRRQVKASTRDPDLLTAAAALNDGRLPEAETLLRERLRRAPTDVAALRLFAQLAARIGRNGDAQALLERCLELAPGFTAARSNLALVLHRNNQPARALEIVEALLAAEPDNPSLRGLKAAVLARTGEVDRAIGLYAGLLREYPGQVKLWLSQGHALKTAGRQQESIGAYRQCVELQPQHGEAWWSLANLKTFRFEPADIEVMQRQLARTDLDDEDRLHLEFALGKALEDARSYAESFQHYAAGNALRRQRSAYDPNDTSLRVRRARATYTPEFFAARSGYGCAQPDPIFILGLPRSGSTLLEQILSSHPLVEGTMELPDIISLVRQLRGQADGSSYHAEVAALSADQARSLGEEYLARTRIQRKTDRPYFIDKMPNNWAHAGFIQVILPQARIIDARRHPLACCFSNFKQHFARGQNYTYDLGEIGRYYRDYVELMAHFDAVLPGRIHRVIYEQVVADTDSEIRRLLDYCGLPFDAACLRFYENDRAVRTASSEQVRQPIYREGLDQWRHYEPWLGPLKAALGPVLDAYPAVPAFPSVPCTP